MGYTAALAATHSVAVAASSDEGCYCVEHRTAGPPDDGLLVVMAADARRTHLALYDDEPVRLAVTVTPLDAAERSCEERRVAGVMARDELGRGLAEELGFNVDGTLLLALQMIVDDEGAEGH